MYMGYTGKTCGVLNFSGTRTGQKLWNGFIGVFSMFSVAGIGNV
jgi:hypothetical protein